MIRCLAVDDEAYAAEIIATFIKKTPFLELSGTCTNAIDALHLVQQGLVDLVFLDIQMPDLTGIQFLKIVGKQCKVILTTAYPDYALEGYELDVVDYLMKPIAFDRFLRAVQKAQALIQQTPKPTEIMPEGSQSTQRYADYLFIKGDGKHRFVKVNCADILYIEGLKNYVSIYTESERHISYQRLADLQEELESPPFFRIHKSYIISIDHIKRIEGNAVLIGERFLPISESYRERFYSWIKREK